MIGYLQYAVGLEPIGCLKERELYSGNFDVGDIISFRSPLVDPSEVNKVKIVIQELRKKHPYEEPAIDIIPLNHLDLEIYHKSLARINWLDFLLYLYWQEN